MLAVNGPKYYVVQFNEHEAWYGNFRKFSYNSMHWLIETPIECAKAKNLNI
jgi:hypothetical protein